MGEKDTTEKLLEDYNDVFADIVNGVIFKGKPIVKEDDLQAVSIYSQYKADNSKIHEQERDVIKNWLNSNISIATLGLENQTDTCSIMPARIIGYDGAAYRSQILGSNQPDHIIPVVSLILYFGTNHWNPDKMTLKSIMNLENIPDEMIPYINDYRIHVIEVSWLTDEEIEYFTSDFKVIARFFADKRKNPDMISHDKTTIKHVDEVLKLLSVMTKDHRFEDVLVDVNQESEKGEVCMCTVLDKVENIGVEKGKIKGKTEGQNLLVEAVKLIRAGHTEDDLRKAGFDDYTINLAISIK